MDRSQFEIIEELMDELKDKMEYGEDDFSERLGRYKEDSHKNMPPTDEGLMKGHHKESYGTPKPGMKVKQDVPAKKTHLDIYDQETSDEDDHHSHDDDHHSYDDDPEEKLKRRILKMRE